jgi:hypothetical protein
VRRASRTALGPILAALTLAVAACTRARPDAPLGVRELPTPAAPGSGQPNLTTSSDGRVLLSWIEAAGAERHRLRFAERPRGGGWSEPRTIGEGTGWFVNWADFPAMSALSDGTLFAHWLARSGPGTYSYDVRVVASRDGGQTWSAPVVPHRDGTQSEHGFVSMTPSSALAMGLVWLDGRKTAGAAHEGHAAGGAEMALVHSTLDATGRLGPETVLDGRVCECCQTDSTQAEGATLVVYRDRSEGEVRDMSIVRLVGGRWTEPLTVARDGWEINGCPVNGPAIAASGTKAAVAWFTAAGGESRVMIAFSSDSGATFADSIVVDDGRPLGRVDVVLPKGEEALVSWLERTEKGAALRVRRVTARGQRGPALTVADSSAARSSGFPRMVESAGEVVVAWRDSDEPPKVRTAVLSP